MAVERARRHEEFVFAVLFLDLDRFKNVNDSLGHTVGDGLLIAISRRLQHCLRPIDVVARLGGDGGAGPLDDLGAHPRAAPAARPPACTPACARWTWGRASAATSLRSS